MRLFIFSPVRNKCASQGLKLGHAISSSINCVLKEAIFGIIFVYMILLSANHHCSFSLAVMQKKVFPT